ncbi:molybdenum cofactor sulfurase [Jiella sp. MQZ9-1]|uniref:Molybdenum cofactor sulfurase n=1 Tax=Jiella flava TaxID=2816857 RepID=A0A939FZ77_9HYPH|nr:molybdenum cofactor sulfurase [Jiella flava]MBO0662713.1 molybdenum cofactor sulfurase [Jiella flava]MCD2471135.1 molybdenum cofactor sulfurase [Jiella flava]
MRQTELPIFSSPQVVRGTRIEGRVLGLYRTLADGFETTAVETLELGFGGIAGDRHGGMTRRSGGREPWYERDTEMRNERQLSLLAPDELAAVAAELGIAEIRPEWIGGNLLVDGIPQLSFLPPRTLLFFENGVTLKIDGHNNPCRYAGRAIADQAGGGTDVELGFVKAAKHRRGLVAWVEKPGVIAANERFEARVPEQWIYPG